MKKLCVIGSFNIDIVASTEKLPQVGESVFCDRFEILIGGGKGANQAVSAGRAGADVSMVGCLGDQFYGRDYLDVLEKNNVNHECVEVLPNQYPGRAFVVANPFGENLLFVSSGTNMMVDIDYIKKYWDKIIAHDIFLLQYEIPIETNVFLAKELKALGKTVILDPAPAKEVPQELYQYIDYITPNEVEIEQITGVKIEKEANLKQAAKILLDYGVKNVVAKRGKNGAYLINGETCVHIPAFSCIRAIDTTAAGDTFNGIFAYGLSMGESTEESIRMANAAAGICTTKNGAQTAMPTKQELDEFLSLHRNKD